MTELREMIRQAQSGDKTARDQLVTMNTGLVRSIVGRFHDNSVEKEDLFQIGMIGLMKAIDYFDCTYEVRFSTYAVPMITGEIRRFLRDDGMVKVSRSIKDHRMTIFKIREELTIKFGREPVLGEIVAASQLSVEEVLLAMNAGQEVASLHQTIYEGDGSSIRLMDKLAIGGDEGNEIVNRMLLADTLSALGGQERELIILRFYMDQTQSQIAQRLGVSQVQVSRLEKRILKKMKMMIS